MAIALLAVFVAVNDCIDGEVIGIWPILFLDWLSNVGDSSGTFRGENGLETPADEIDEIAICSLNRLNMDFAESKPPPLAFGLPVDCGLDLCSEAIFEIVSPAGVAGCTAFDGRRDKLLCA